MGLYRDMLTVAGWGLGMSPSFTGNQVKCADFCSLKPPSKVAITSDILNAHTADPDMLFLLKEYKKFKKFVQPKNINLVNLKT